MSSEKPDTFATSGDSSQALQAAEDENAKSCWVCFATEADDKLAAWVQPCKCIGTTKWVSTSSRPRCRDANFGCRVVKTFSGLQAIFWWETHVYWPDLRVGFI